MRSIPILAVLTLLLGGCVQSNVPTDEMLLARVLERHYDDGGYTVVETETTLSHLDERIWGTSPAATRENLRTQLALAGFAVGPLVDSLFDKNAKPVKISLPSHPERGYVVDHDGKFKRYFGNEAAGGWKKWYLENPTAHGLTEVSLPAYDPATRLLLIYTGTQRHWLDGAGYLVMYRLEDGQLTEVWRMGLWLS